MMEGGFGGVRNEYVGKQRMWTMTEKTMKMDGINDVSEGKKKDGVQNDKVKVKDRIYIDEVRILEFWPGERRF